MPDKDGNRSNPYRPNPEYCCEACVFGRGEHSDWCESVVVLVDEEGEQHVFDGFHDVGLFESLLSGCVMTTGTAALLEREISRLENALALSIGDSYKNPGDNPA